jgi:hypothetical protein
MSKGLARQLRLRFPLLTMLILVALVSARSAAVVADSREFKGACYCRAQGELMCTANVTARECDLRSKLALCDEWFWKERLACWNWGYGG